MFAVNCPPQAPALGHATFSKSTKSFSVAPPAAYLPTASNTSTTVTSFPLYRPGNIEPPYIKTLGTFKRHIAIISPGKDLSHPANPTRAS